uniref:Uncharacterized protein n=1 Tax=viral metagenome TaxID=1070528 RepID=A0A6C0JHU2_9ZZZZ
MGVLNKKRCKDFYIICIQNYIKIHNIKFNNN